MISPLGFALKVLGLVILGFLGFAFGGCAILWASFEIANWLFGEREKMDEFRKSSEWLEGEKEFDEGLEKACEEEAEFIKEFERGKSDVL